MVNHILIGLGGTGGKVIAAFRRSLYELEGTASPESPALGYLYVDSSPDYFSRKNDLWRIPGDSLYIGDNSTLNIQGQNLGHTLRNVSQYPSIRPWIGDVKMWSHIQAAVDSGIGGQKRRLGRFAFACQAGDFVKKVDAEYGACTRKSTTTDTVFHVIAGLAGGTGSGSIVDAIALIRKTYNTNKQHRIFVYALLPDMPSDWYKKGTAYYANGYAALMELNALAVGDYQPFDLAGTGDRVRLASGAYEKSNEAPPFDGCYVFTNVNEVGRVIDITKRGDFYTVIGGFLYQKIFAVDDHAWQEKLSDYETMENMRSDPSESAGSTPVRSMRFASFGIKRIVIPEREIKEYLVYRSAEQALLQSLYNHLTDHGYEESVPSGAFEPTDNKKRGAMRAKWKMSEEHLTQEFPVIEPPPGSPEYRSYKEEWGLADKLVRVAKENSPNPLSWMSKLNEVCTKRFDTDFRGVGVAEFFRLRSREINAQARTIATAVETDLFSRWETGEWGLVTCQEALTAEIQWLSGRRDEITKRAQKLNDAIGNAKNRSEVLRLIDANNKEWAKVGPLSSWLGKREELLAAQASLYMENYRQQTLLLASTHAGELINVLLQYLRELDNTLTNFITLHTHVLNGVSAGKTYHGIRNHITDRCQIKTASYDLGEPVVKYYDPADVRTFADVMFNDKEICHTFAANFRQTVSRSTGSQKGFTALNSQTDFQKLEDAATNATVETLVASRHNLLVERGTVASAVLGQNIVDKLSSKLAGSSNDLDEFCKEVMHHAGTFFKIDKTQRGAQGPDLKDENDDSTTCVLVPPAPNSVDFRGKLLAALNSQSSGTIKKDEIEGRKPQEIVIITLRNLFPLRYGQAVSELRRKYNEYLDGAPGEENKARALMELHSEERIFPPLFPLDVEEKNLHYRPYFLLAMAAGIIGQVRDPSSGKDTLIFRKAGAPAERLAPSIDESIRGATLDTLQSVEVDVRNAITAKGPAEGAQWFNELEKMIANLGVQYDNELDERRNKEERALREAQRLARGN